VPNPWEAILEQIKPLEVHEQRSRTENYFEAVIFNRDLAKWSEQLGVHLGEAAKPAGKSPSKEVKELTDPFGGIRKEQTFFYKAFETYAVIAMFWPWGDQQHSTLKMWINALPGA
jgi:hypothetical protein